MAERRRQPAAGGDVVVKGGRVVDGTGAPSVPTDVRVVQGVITEIGPNLAVAGEQVVDARGAVVAPGFIDVHTHLDPSLFWDPLADPLPQHGVTSVVIGNCSLSLAPLRPEHRETFSRLFAYIEDIPEEVFRSALPWSWESFPEYLDAIDSTAVNVGALVGHTPLRLWVLGDAAWERRATKDEAKEIASLLRDCLRAGASGLSSSLNDTDLTGRPVPSRLADQDEWTALFAVLAEHDALMELVPNMHEYTDGLARMAALSARSGVAVTWTGGVNAFPGDPTQHLRRMQDVDGWRDAGARMHPQISPRSFDIQVNWGRSIAFRALPTTWHQVIHANDEGKGARLVDPGWRARARAEWDASDASVFTLRDPARVRLVSVARPDLERWVGHTLAELVADTGDHPSDVLADWVVANDLRPGVVATAVSNDDPDAVAWILKHPAAIVGSGDAGAHSAMMCAYGDTTLLLTKFVRDRGDLTVEAAVHALTGRLAEVLGWRDRGTIATGMAGDLTVFALDELDWRPDAFVDDIPEGGRRLRRPAGGFRSTIVDGVVTQDGGDLTGRRPGRVVSGR
jgi:N-acyl-D-amino-acid deacylase